MIATHGLSIGTMTLDDLEPTWLKVITITVKYFDNGVWNATTLGRYMFYRTYFLFSKSNQTNNSNTNNKTQWKVARVGKRPSKLATSDNNIVISLVIYLR